MTRLLAPALAGLATVALAAASASGQTPATPGPQGGSPPGLEQAVAVQERHTDRLLDTPGIVGTGVGLNQAGRPVIRVYMEHPGVADVPGSLEGVSVERVTTGTIGVRAPTDRFPRPVPIGVSSGHLDTATGTLGARVSDGTNVYALSNNHVYAAINAASVGDGIIQPGNVDGGRDPADRIGTLHAFEPIKFETGTTNTIDAAIALTSTANVGVATPSDGYGTPSSVTTAAFVGQEVQKYGRTTGLQLGTVAEINVTVDVCYIWFIVCFEDARFVGQVSITPDGFSAGGDSGSLIVTQGGNQPVALLFAGGEGRTIGNPIDLVLQRFGVTIDGTPLDDGPPAAPSSLSALAGDGAVSLSWSAPSFDGGSPITSYRIYRGESPGGETFLTSLGTVTSFQDSGLTNGTTYYYRVSAENALGEGPLSTEASATPQAAVTPSEPLPTLDDFNRANETLSDSGRWANGVIGSVETGLGVTSNQLACSKSTTCTAWRSDTQYGPDVEVWTQIATLPGENNQIRLKARLREVGGSGYDGYMLRTNQLAGADEVYLERVDDGSTFVRLLTVARELALGDRLLLRVQGSTLEAWHHDGSAWSRLGVVTDGTYPAAGYVGIGLRGTSGRLDDFGARTMGSALPLQIETASLPGGTVGEGYSQSVTASGGEGSYSWSVASGSLPEGLALSSGTPSATISGTPGAAGDYAFTLQVSDGTQTTTQALSIAVLAAPPPTVVPTEPLLTLDDFDRADETLSDSGRWTNGVIGSAETGLQVSSNQLACSKSTTCTAWRSDTQLGPDTEVWARIPALPGDGNAVLLYARLQAPGSASVDGYRLRTDQLPGTDEIHLERVDGGAVSRLLTVAQEIEAADTLLLRVQGSTLEAWRHDGTSWSRVGAVTDSTHSGPGYSGVGIQGATGRLDDFGARAPGAVAVESVTYATEGGRTNSNHLVVGVRIVLGTTPVANASVTISLFRNGTLYATRTATTGADGRASFKITNYPAGCYTTLVAQVTLGGQTAMPPTPTNSHCK